MKERQILTQRDLGLTLGGKDGTENIEPHTFPSYVTQLIYARLRVLEGLQIHLDLSGFAVEEADGSVRDLTHTDLQLPLKKW